MTKYKDKQEKQEELKSCPVAAALAPEITAMEARGREAVKRYLEYDLPAEVSARNANY